MASHRLEVILMRELAEHLGMPIFVVGSDGALEFYNEPAEKLLGLRYDETGSMPLAEWSTRFVPTDRDGRLLTPDELPLVIALQESRAAHGDFWIEGDDGVRRHLEVTAMPLSAQAGRDVGATAIFWEGKG